jgi:hypothetical protein
VELPQQCLGYLPFTEWDAYPETNPLLDLTINGWVLWKLTPNLSSFQSWQRINKNAWKVEEELRHALNISMVAASAPGRFTNLGAAERWNMLSHRYN